MKSGSHHCRGYALLELCAVLVILISLLLGSIDLLNYFRVRSALREAAAIAVRHLKTLNGGAVSVSNDANSRLYDWKVYTLDTASNPPVRNAHVVAQSVSSDFVPAECIAPADGVSCTRTFRGFGGVPTPIARTFDLNHAVQYYALGELRSVLPRVIPGCIEQDFCLSIESATDLSPGAAPDTIEVRLRYQLPILFLGTTRSIPVRAVVRERLETGYLNRTPEVVMAQLYPDDVED